MAKERKIVPQSLQIKVQPFYPDCRLAYEVDHNANKTETLGRSDYMTKEVLNPYFILRNEIKKLTGRWVMLSDIAQIILDSPTLINRIKKEKIGINT